MEKTSTVYQVASWLILLVSIGILVYSTWCGLGLTYDSHDYLAAAATFGESGVFLNKNGEPFIAHSPLFPILVSMMGESPLSLIMGANLLFYVISMIILLKVIRLLIHNEFLRIGVYFSIVFAVGIQMIYNFVWSEPLFLFLFTFHNWYLIMYLKEGKPKDLRILIFVTFLMGITRNAGFFIIMPTTMILFADKNIGRSASLYYFILGAFGFVVWNMYAFFIQDGITTFKEGLSLFTAIGLNVRNYLDVISTWVLPSFLPLIIRITLVLMLIVLLIVKFKIRRIIMEGRVFFFQSVVYTCILIIFISVYKSDVERYLAVMYPWIFISIFIILDSWILRFSLLTKRLLILLLSCWFCYVSARTIKNSAMWHRNHCIAEKIYKSNNLSD